MRTSHSRNMVANECPFKFQLKYIEGWSKEPRPDSPLNVGKHWSNVMESFYTIGVAAAINRVYEAGEEIRDLLWWMIEGYRQQYGDVSEWEVLYCEEEFRFELPRPKGDYPEVQCLIKPDLVVATKHGVMVVDHKSSRNLYGVDSLDQSDQLLLYAYGLKAHGIEVQFQMYNVARTLRLKREMALHERFNRIQGRATRATVEEAARETYLNYHRVQLAADKVLPENNLPRSVSRACGYCEFFRPCMASRGKPHKVNLELNGFKQEG